MIRLLFTRSKKPLSKLIRWVFNEPCSHFAISFDDHFVFHSNLTGTHPTFFWWFKNEVELVHAIIVLTTPESEELVWQNIVKKFDRPKPYDFGAFLFFGFSGLAHRFFGRPMPTKNIWANSEAFLCGELAEVLEPILNVPKNLDLVTPERLWLTLEPRGNTNGINGTTQST